MQRIFILYCFLLFAGGLSAQVNSVSYNDVTECGGANGSIFVDTDQGATYQFVLTHDGVATASNTSGSFVDLPHGDYSVSVFTAEGTLVYTTEVTIAPAEIIAITSLISINGSCDAEDGMITVTSSSANAEYSIDGGMTWSSTNTYTNLASGVYNVRVRSTASGCVTAYPTLVHLQSESPIITAINFTESSCDVANGMIAIAAEAGEALEYSIDGSTWNSNNVFTGLSSGTYYVSVRTLSGLCTVFYATPITISGNYVLNATVASTNATSCTTDDGTITMAHDNDDSWSFEYSIDGFSYSSNSTFTGLAPGTYYPQIRTAAGECTTELGAMHISASGQPDVTGTSYTSPSSCELTDGTITFQLGNDAPAKFSIDGGFTFQTSNQFFFLAAGNYSLVARNTDGSCAFDYGKITLLEAPSPQLLSVKYTDAGEEGTGSIHLVSNQSAVEYGVTMPDGLTVWQTSGDFTGLQPGTYYVAVRSSTGQCTNTYGTVIVIDAFQPASLPTSVLEKTAYSDPGQVIDLPFQSELPGSETQTQATHNAWTTYPNPATDYLQLRAPRSFAAGTLTLHDNSGRLVRSYTYTTNEQYSLTSLPAGAYVLIVRDVNGLPVHREMVTKF